MNKNIPFSNNLQKGKLINSMFGSNVPELMALITQELRIEREMQKNPASTERHYYELGELTPREQERYDRQRQLADEAARIEREAQHKRRQEYLAFVTERITQRTSDCGVTVFLPHLVGRDLLKRVSDAADKFQLAVRDKKVVQILEEHLDAMHYDCANPMPAYVIDHLLRKDVFMVCWKLPDGDARAIEGIICCVAQCGLQKLIDRFCSSCADRRAERVHCGRSE